MVKEFTDANVRTWTNERTGQPMYKIYCDIEDLIDAPLWWHERGLQQTTSGYGRKLTQRYKIRFNGKDYRLYTTIFSNAGSTWFQVRGRKIFVD